MSRLKYVGLKFRSLFYKFDGTPFYGQILEIPDTSRVSNFLSTRRYLRTQIETNVRLRDIVIFNGTKAVVAEHGDGFYKIPIYRHFKLFEINEEGNWFQKRKKIDPVTGVESPERDDLKGLVFLSVQPKTDIEDKIKIQQNTKMAICNADVKVDDRIDDWVVTKADTVLGVTLLEMKII